MLWMRKGRLALVLVIALIIGCAGGLAAMQAGLLEPLSQRLGVMSLIRADELAEYRHLQQVYGKADALRRYIGEAFYREADEEALDLGMLRGLFEGLGDPYSHYLTPDEYEQMLSHLSGEYSGIGVTLSPDHLGFIEVVAVAQGGPAQEAGILVGDQILEVDGVAYAGYELDLAAAVMRGLEGTPVRLTLLRGGQPLELELIRRTIVTHTVSWDFVEEGVGLIHISSFEEHTAEEFDQALAALEEKKASAFILDLRNNPGGYVHTAIQVADALMDGGTVVYSQDRQGVRDYYRVDEGATELPFAVLVNQRTASAAEMLCAGLQDNQVATILGTQTFGKGVIQQLDRLADGSAVYLTILEYFSPGGQTIHQVGIAPDILVEAQPEDFDEEGLPVYDRQLARALELLRTGR